ncbi:MAG TPA: hypothetical protein VGK30_16810 [Candidatus Binatia bacterium]|jgi:pimeloyl-ACP methyl ester carboxylesterase
MLWSMLWWIVKAVVSVAALVQAVCFLVALYEMLNLPESLDARLTPASLLGAAREVALEIAAMSVALLAVPFGALAWRRVPSVVAQERPPIVFVPGYATTRSCLWLLRRRLAAAGWAQAAGFNYRSVLGDVAAAARGLDTLLDQIRASAGDRDVVVVAHGIGGIVARLCVRERRGSGVAALVTLGTPHQGSKLYALALDPMLAGLRPGSELIAHLAADDPLLADTDVTAVASSFDFTVVPSAAARYPGASTIEIEGVGHFGLLWSRRVFEVVRENLDFAHGAAQPSASAATQRATSSAFE